MKNRLFTDDAIQHSAIYTRQSYSTDDTYKEIYTSFNEACNRKRQSSTIFCAEGFVNAVLLEPTLSFRWLKSATRRPQRLLFTLCTAVMLLSDRSHACTCSTATGRWLEWLLAAPLCSLKGMPHHTCNLRGISRIFTSSMLAVSQPSRLSIAITYKVQAL